MSLLPGWIILLLFLVFLSLSVAGLVAEEEFTEELLLKPLPDRKVLAHFHFQSRAPSSNSDSYGRHHQIFPKAISQLVQKHRVKEMELSFTQGRWNYERWGGFDPISSKNAKPPGVELWAVFDVAPDEVDGSWKNLTHVLSGLFCASINFLESSTMYSAPDWVLRTTSGGLRYGTLPREAVCTENLTPWLKLLPCRDKAGLSALMDRPSVYKGFYHSQRLRLTSSYLDSKDKLFGMILDQTLTVVLQPKTQRTGSTYSSETKLQPSWSLSSIFGKNVIGPCLLARSSVVYLMLERGLTTELKNLQGPTNLASEDLQFNPAFELSMAPDKVLKEMVGLHEFSSSIVYVFSINKNSVLKPVDLSLTWKVPLVWSCLQAPLHATRFLMGSGNERGAIAISLKPTQLTELFIKSKVIKENGELRVKVFQAVPWYIKVYFHTLQVFLDGNPMEVSDVVEKMVVSPSEDKVSPGVMEIVLKFPCGLKSASLTIEFDKGFLHIDEYPPDANQGFDIPSAVVSFPDFHVHMQLAEDDSLNDSPMLSKFQEESPVLSYTEALLVPLTTPDFSMPYNVITITCTIFALYFGSLLNVLRRRVNEEERYLKNKADTRVQLFPLLSKLTAKLRGRPWKPAESASTSSSSSSTSSKLLLKIILVAVLAAIWQYYLG